jgi:hypothetical protein
MRWPLDALLKSLAVEEEAWRLASDNVMKV